MGADTETRGQEVSGELEEKLKELHTASRYSQHNHIEYVSVERDCARFRLNIREESRNGFGFVHGAAIYLLSDNACGHAADSDGRMYVTQSGGLNFISNQREGTVTAEARVVHRGRKTCLIRVDVRGEGEKLLATGEFTYFCIKE